MPTSREIIVVVEDGDLMREALADILGLEGAKEDHIRSFANGAEVLAFLREAGWTAAVVICDMATPHVNGVELYKRVHAHAPELKFVFITGYELARSERRFLENECLAVLKKPFTTAEMVAAILKASNQD